MTTENINEYYEEEPKILAKFNDNVKADEVMSFKEEDENNIPAEEQLEFKEENTDNSKKEFLLTASDLKDDVMEDPRTGLVSTENDSEEKDNKVTLDLQYENPNVTMMEDPRLPVDGAPKEPPLYITTASVEQITTVAESPYFSANIENFDDDYKTAIMDSMSILHLDDVHNKALEQDSEFVQQVSTEDKTIKSFVPKWSNKPNEALTGIKAVAAIQNALRQGSFFTFPCWNSGIWITLKAPTVYQLADLYDTISREVIELGKQTNGGIFGNTQVYINNHLVTLAEKLVYDWSLNEQHGSKRSLRDVLLVPDIETIAWALAVIMHPNGYPFEEACTVDVEKCNHVYSTIININKLFWVNKKRLSKQQIDFMGATIKTKRHWDDIVKYRNEAEWLEPVRIDYGNFELSITTPTIGEHIEAGYRWITELEKSSREVMHDSTDNKLNEVIYNRAALTVTRSYSHYVKAIIFKNGARITESTDIDNALNEISNSPDLVEKFTKGVNDQILNSTISIVAVNRHRCPNCQKDSNEHDKTHPFLIPLSAPKLFFNLRDLRILLG